MDPHIFYVELPAKDHERTKTFYSSAFGWALTDFGPTYSSTLALDVNLGLQADTAQATSAPLTVINVADLERAREMVTQAGGTLTRPIFSFPGGRRFQFRDPSGNELAVMQEA